MNRAGPIRGDLRHSRFGMAGGEDNVTQAQDGGRIRVPVRDLVLPKWRGVPPKDLKHGDLQQWVTGLSITGAPARAARAYRRHG
jgi:hypothetical protein